MRFIINFLYIFLFSGLLSACSFEETNQSTLPLEANSVQETASEEGYLQLNGVKLYYKILGEGDPVIILHGGPGLHHGYLLAELPILSKKHKLVFYDQRGSGKSVPAVLDTENINIEVFVQDLENLRESLGLEKFSLVGHSWGGFLAMHYAIHHPENLSSLILMNSSSATIRGITAEVDESNRRMADIADEINAIQNSEAFSKGEAQKVVDFYRLIFSTYFFESKKVELLPLEFEASSALSGFEVSNIFTELIFSKGVNLLPQLKELAVPTLVIHGDSDPAPVWTAEEIASAIPNAELFIISQCGHFPYIEHPEELLPKLDNFIREHSQEKIWRYNDLINDRPLNLQKAIEDGYF